jgi:L-lysine 6-transaminase
MVRSKHILRIIQEENLVENAKVVGEHLLKRLKEIQNDFSNLISNARGLGLMCSFDLPSAEKRNKFKETCLKEKLIILGCGERSMRFRPPLNITKDEIDEGLNVIRKVLFLLS